MRPHGGGDLDNKHRREESEEANPHLDLRLPASRTSEKQILLFQLCSLSELTANKYIPLGKTHLTTEVYSTLRHFVLEFATWALGSFHTDYTPRQVISALWHIFMTLEMIIYSRPKET